MFEVRIGHGGVIEQAMVFALGFLIAGLIALVIAPAFWRRALRLTTRRIEMQIPLSAREILADRDLIRANFAVERRQLEQRAESLNNIRAKDLSELGRRAALIVAQQTNLTALGERNAEQAAELASLRRALAETSTELAASATALYGATNLVERRDAELMALRQEFSALQELAEQRHVALAASAIDIAVLEKKLAAASAEVARRERDIESMRLERDADLATLKSTAAKLADREDALKAAEKRELDLDRRRKQQIETTRAIESRLLEKVERLRAAEAASHAALEVARANCDSLTRELAGLRLAAPGREAEPLSAEREENAILRQNINELGAAIIRMAAPCVGPAPEEPSPSQDDAPSENRAKVAGRVLAKAGGGAAAE